MSHCQKHGYNYHGVLKECPLCVAEERDRRLAVCVKIFQHGENMIANVEQCDYRYYQGRMMAVESVLKSAGYDSKGGKK